MISGVICGVKCIGNPKMYGCLFVYFGVIFGVIFGVKCIGNPKMYGCLLLLFLV